MDQLRTSGHSPSSSGEHVGFSRPEDEISKDLQIKILQDKLEFTQKQLQEKDEQLEHYKQLVKTLNDLLAEVSGRGRFPPKVGSPFPGMTVPNSTSPNNNNSEKTVQPPIARPPPGFENNKQIKGKPKAISFHSDMSANHSTTIYDSDDEDVFQRIEREREKEQAQAQSWRRPPDVPFEPPQLPKSPTASQSPTQHPPSPSARQLKKSVSHTSLIDQSLRPNASNVSPFPSSLPARIEPSNPSPFLVSPTSSSIPSLAPSHSLPASIAPLQDEKPGKLKKSQSMTSVYSVLEENRLDLKFPELDQLIGQIYALSKYQQGCRFLQKKLDENNPLNTRIILNELQNHLVELMTDPFGNYLFSKLMEHCDSPQREQILQKILTDLLPTAFDMYGTQSMQKMMPFLTEGQIEQVINALKPNAIALIKHNKANYLIQYCLDHLPQRHNQWIYDAVVEQMEEVARDRVGCVIVKRCIDHATDDQRYLLSREICNKVLRLVQDPFGNYVVQHILDKYPTDEYSQGLIANLLGNVTELCVQKFSSPVIEKCLQVSNPTVRKAVLQEITESDILPQLLNDRFANFVIQTALDVADSEDRQKLVKNILPHLGRHYSPYTKRLQKKILQVSEKA